MAIYTGDGCALNIHRLNYFFNGHNAFTPVVLGGCLVTIVMGKCGN